MSLELGDAVPRRGNRFTKAVATALMRLAGWHIVLDNMPNQPKMLLVGAPHTSNWDFFLTLGAVFQLSVRISWMGKHTMFRWPIGGLMRWLGGVAIDRRTRGNIVDKTVAAFNTHDQFVIAIMPEGTRSRVEGWKSGFYYIAQGAAVPLVPVVFDYGTKRMTIGPAFDLTGNIDVDLPMIKAHFATAKARHPELV